MNLTEEPLEILTNAWFIINEEMLIPALLLLASFQRPAKLVFALRQSFVEFLNGSFLGSFSLIAYCENQLRLPAIANISSQSYE
jgi:hypothetical protein